MVHKRYHPASLPRYTPAMALLSKGTAAPDFDLGDGRKASEVWAEKHLVLYFFPKAFTPG